MDFFAIISAVLQLSNYNFRKFAALLASAAWCGAHPPHLPRYASGLGCTVHAAQPKLNLVHFSLKSVIWWQQI